MCIAALVLAWFNAVNYVLSMQLKSTLSVTELENKREVQSLQDELRKEKVCATLFTFLPLCLHFSTVMQLIILMPYSVIYVMYATVVL